MDERIARLRKKAMALPFTPGIYIMKNGGGQVIYVGKAKAMKSRVSQYFGSQNGHDEKVKKMVENVEDFDYILTDTEYEAFILECSMIKQHMPKYNIRLKDDKGYQYLRITNGEWRTISAVRKRENDGAVYFGPYLGFIAVEDTKKIFKLPQCSRVFPRDIGKGRPCLRFFISQCSAPCAGKISREEHNKTVEEALRYLQGDKDTALETIKNEMNKAAERLDFERAARLRDRMNAITKMKQKQKIISTSFKDQDVFSIVSSFGSACFSVLRFSEGALYDSEHFFVDLPENAAEARHELLRSFYSMRENIPPRIMVDGEVESSAVLEQWLSEKADRKVRFYIPQRGEPLALMEMCRSNASQKLAQRIGKTSGKTTAALDELAKLLGLEAPPEFIEAYDISHTAGSQNVAGMVVFQNGQPYKKGYRHFAIKGFEGQDDYASMAEVLTRRLNRYIEEKGSGEGFGRLPDLILLDGGTGQVNAVLPVIRSFGLSIPVFGMVKDGSHKTRAIAANGGEVSLNSKRKAFSLVFEIQEEVHRFAISYHRKKRSKAAVSSTLTSIEGIGEARARALMKKFKTIKAIGEASEEELAATEGITKKNAAEIFKAFHGRRPEDTPN